MEHQPKKPTTSMSANELIWQLRKDEPKFAGPSALGHIHYPNLQLEVNSDAGKFQTPDIYKGFFFKALNLVKNTSSNSPSTDGFGIEYFSEVERAKLEMINLLIDDKDYKPDKISLRKSACWSEAAEILSGMPFEFRTEALDRCEEGIRVFGKVPAEVAMEDGKVVSIEVVGPARPMGCPEPPPEGSKFLLAWKEGSLWNWNLGEHTAGYDLVRVGRFRPGIASECTKYFKYLLQLEFKRDHPLALDARTIVDLVECCDDSLANQDTATGFYAGVLFSRLFLYAEADDYYADKAAVKKTEWPDIIVHALDQHGWKTSVQQLLTLFGYRLDQSRNALAQNESNREVMFPDWPYTPVPRDKGSLTLRSFGKKFSDVKKRRKPEEHRDPSQMSRLRALLREESR